MVPGNGHSFFWEARVLVGCPDSRDGDNILISVPRGSIWPLSCSKVGGHSVDMTEGHALSAPLCRQTPDPQENIPVAGPSQTRNKKEGRLVVAHHHSHR